MSESLFAQELSDETGMPVERLEWLAGIGILKPDEPGRFRPGDALRVKMIEALLDAGFTQEQIEWAAGHDALNLDHVDHYLLVGPTKKSTRSFAEFSEEMAARSTLLPAVYKTLGLPEPDPAAPIDVLEEALLEQFLEGWRLAGDDHTPIRAARLMGDGTRLAAVGWMDLFLEQVAGPARERFLEHEVETFPAEVSRASTMLVRLMPRLMAWLTQRYVEQLIFAGIVDGFEAVLASRGQVPVPPPTDPPAVVFADISGYTRLTDEQGDEAAVRVAASLQDRAEAVATEHGGRLVKLLGDGAMMYFPDPARGAQAALRLVRTLTDDVRLTARAGVHTGPVVERDRDLYGRTVNMAARLAEAASPGEVLVSGELARSAGDGARFEPAGEASLKGFAEPVAVFVMSASQKAS